MFSHLFHDKVLPLAVGVLLIPVSAAADQLIMNNGDIISGDISKIEGDKVYINPSYTDEYAVDIAEVASIDADTVFEVELADGRSLEGQFESAAEGEQTLVVDENAMSVEILDVAGAIDPLLVVEVDAWDGEGEFGFVNTTGNTETVALNMRLNFVRTSERWRHRFTGTALHTSENGIDDNERYSIEVQSDRTLNEKSWLFGAFRWDADKFGAYDPQVSFSTGYGYQLMSSDRHELRGEIGLGYRKLEERVTGISSNEAIGRFLLDDTWQVFDSMSWSNRLLVEAGSSNVFSQFNSALSVSMSDRFAVKLGYEVRHNSEIPPGDSENTDSITSANLVYNF